VPTLQHDKLLVSPLSRDSPSAKSLAEHASAEASVNSMSISPSSQSAVKRMVVPADLQLPILQPAQPVLHRTFDDSWHDLQ
jgi:hypothetical protein